MGLVSYLEKLEPLCFGIMIHLWIDLCGAIF